MYQTHSFILPMREFVKDVADLLNELQKQVSVARSCLVCMRGFKSGELVQKHMCGSGHTVFQPENFVRDFIAFYDFTSSYPEKLLAMIKQENDLQLLKEISQKRYYFMLDDVKYEVEGKEATYLEWKQWKSYHVPEWLKIKYE